MVDNRIALLAKTADVPGAIQKHETGRLQNLLRQAKVDDIPAQRQASEQKLAFDERKAQIDEQNQTIKMQEFLQSQDDRTRENAIRTSQQLLQVQSPEDFEAFKKANPIDTGPFANVQFGSPEFLEAQRGANILVRAAQPVQAPDRTLVEVADPTSPTGTRLVPRAEAAGQPGKPASGTSLTVGPDGEVVLSQGRGVTQAGNIVPDKKVMRELQNDIVSLDSTQQQLNNINKTFDTDFLTFQGKIAGKLSSLKAKADIDLTGDEREFLRGKVQFENRVEQFFNLYRKEITGAAASVKELDRLKASMLNVDQDPVSFQASLDVAIDNAKRALRLKRKFLREGISIKDNGDKFDSAFLGQDDDNPDIRMRELQQQGLSLDEAVDKLIEEGYQ